MDVYRVDVDKYYEWNILLLSAIGGWPYDRSAFARGVRICVSIVLLFAISAQLGGLQEVKYELDAVLKSISYILITCGLLVKYGSWLMLQPTALQMMDAIRRNWQYLVNAEERDIMKKYALKGKFHTVTFALMLYPAAIGLSLFPFGAVILEIIFPLNQSRTLEFPTPLNMLFFDQKKHFWWTVLVLAVWAFVASTTFVATETVAIQGLQHACALLEITSQRMKMAFEACTTEKSDMEESPTVALISGIEMHKTALDFCKSAKRNFSQPYLILLGLGVSSLTIHLFCLSQIFAGFEKIEQGVSSLFICIAILGYMFYLNYMTQEVIDKSGHILTESYEGPWYAAPIVMQKLLVFIMLKSINVFTFDLFGIFNPSIEGFVLVAIHQITRLSVSYFMVLQSVRNG